MDKIYIETLGCPKNWVDSEKLLGHLSNVSLVINPEEADIIIVNTCSFIQNSRAESIDTILELAQYKENGNCKHLIVTGCLVESHQQELKQELFEVDFFHKQGNNSELTNFLNKKSSLSLQNEYQRVLLNTQGTNYLKISEGCNHSCTFCAIPNFKGKLLSQDKFQLIKEANYLVSKGINEIILVAQDLTSYGQDLENENLVSLLRELVKVKGIQWIRLLYLFPTMISDDLIHIVANEEKICNYFDIPLQHLNNDILKKMGRPGSAEQYYDLVSKIRESLDESAIRTALIVGFPGETDQHFDDMLEKMTQFSFDYLGIFQFSQEEGTKSFDYPNQIPSKTKNYRYQKAMKHQRDISAKRLTQRIGKKYEVLLEEKVQSEPGDFQEYIGRTQFEAPEVDGLTVFTSLNNYQPGDRVPVTIVSSSDYDLYGKDSSLMS